MRQHLTGYHRCRADEVDARLLDATQHNLTQAVVSEDADNMEASPPKNTRVCDEDIQMIEEDAWLDAFIDMDAAW